MPKLVFADEKGNIFDHPELEMAASTGAGLIRPGEAEVIPLPAGSKLFTLPDSLAVGYDPEADAFCSIEEVEHPEGRTRAMALAAFLAPAYARTLLPAARYPGSHPLLPLWAYTAVGWQRGGFCTAAVRVDASHRWDPDRYDDRPLPELIRDRLAASPGNRLLRHLSRCATDYHCFAAKNLFFGRWEAPLPVARACNARCMGCLSEQPEGGPLASHERIDFTSTPEEVAEVAVPHLEGAERAIVSFGQGCEGEPLLEGELLRRSVELMRSRTSRGTINLNTNGFNPESLSELARAGLDSVRISLNSAREPLYNIYFRPEGYGFRDVLAGVRTSVEAGLNTSINLLLFPGVTDREEEVEALLGLIRSTGVHMIQLRNLSIDPELYLSALPEARGKLLGISALIALLQREFAGLALGYFNRPKEEFSTHARASAAIPGAHQRKR